jgi:serine/threonine-protein kinase RsbW
MRRSARPRPGRSAPKRRGAKRAARRRAKIVHFRMASRRDAVAPAVDRVLEAVAPAKLDEDRLTDLAVAVAEALSNAAVHGHGLDSRRTVRVAVATSPGCAVVEVSDSGGGFDSGAVSDPTDPSRHLIPRGRGIFLMRRLVDEVAYNAAGNTVRLTVRQSPDGDGGP